MHLLNEEPVALSQQSNPKPTKTLHGEDVDVLVIGSGPTG